MLRAFFVIFVLCTIAVIAVFGFRGQISTHPPLEVFPDMVRQMKVRAQAPLDFFADGRGPRLPVAGTVPIGYEMPKSETSETQAAAVGPGGDADAIGCAGISGCRGAATSVGVDDGSMLAGLFAGTVIASSPVSTAWRAGSFV